MRRRSNEDISNKAVVLMLVAVILVSVVSLGVYINAVNNAQPEFKSYNEGKVSFTNNPNESNYVSEPDNKTGNIGIIIDN